MSGQASATLYETDLDSDAALEGALARDLSGRGYAAGVEIGRRLELGRVTLTPRAGADWSMVEMSSFTDSANERVSLDAGRRITARAGVRAESAALPGGAGAMFATLDLERELSGAMETTGGGQAALQGRSGSDMGPPRPGRRPRMGRRPHSPPRQRQLRRRPQRQPRLQRQRKPDRALLIAGALPGCAGVPPARCRRARRLRPSRGRAWRLQHAGETLPAPRKRRPRFDDPRPVAAGRSRRRLFADDAISVAVSHVGIGRVFAGYGRDAVAPRFAACKSARCRRRPTKRGGSTSSEAGAASSGGGRTPGTVAPSFCAHSRDGSLSAPGPGQQCPGPGLKRRRWRGGGGERAGCEAQRRDGNGGAQATTHGISSVYRLARDHTHTRAVRQARRRTAAPDICGRAMPLLHGEDGEPVVLRPSRSRCAATASPRG